MKAWETLDEAEIPNGGTMTLCRRDDEYVIFADRLELMSSRRHGSEESLSTETLKRVNCRRLLIGGLGLGYTLRAALDALPADARVVVAELVPEVVKWNRGPLAHLANRPLDDPRVEVRITDVAVPLREPASWDAILLDVDNGPNAFTQNRNNSLYEADGLFTARLALRPGGVLTVWSSDPDRDFERLLQRHGFDNQTLAVPAYPGCRKMHYLFVAKMTDRDNGRRDKYAHRAAQQTSKGGKRHRR
jgi:spermidine synthase